MILILMVLPKSAKILSTIQIPLLDDMVICLPTKIRFSSKGREGGVKCLHIKTVILYHIFYMDFSYLQFHIQYFLFFF